jgi:hypothetical protein
MVKQQVKKMETPPARRVASPTSIPSTFARAAFPLGGIGTGTVSLGARGELRDWELVNSRRRAGRTPTRSSPSTRVPRAASR